jgi:hypothetical protein
MDFIEMPESKKGNKWILTFIDHATGWPIAVPMQKATSQRVTEALWKELVLHYGFPSETLSDRGKNFLSPLVSSFLKEGNIKRLTTSAYHPRTNGKVERFNGILESYLYRMNTTGDKTRWDEFLDAAVFATVRALVGLPSSCSMGNNRGLRGMNPPCARQMWNPHRNRNTIQG